ncbi:3-oxo-5-alpha-steroid 4-dehydrogenase 1-like isoform X2 [Ostrea edulis]|uniref:3-oxo-5-alpha-steroid 4-dehydrogenase 1-like isoform X2 n=1 Tax=Ostrea edulis TaxID=37623 RepID=UPI0024AF818D|nr:3-oxo-5-alpha-steroid 4-dehydrogenase 1-like isoform X2 [Ostrea edulis]
MGVQYWIKKVLDLDLDVLNFLSCNLLLFGVVVVVILQFLSTPYGRYAREGWGAGVNAKLAWFLQELPAFLVPILLVYWTECPKLEFIPNKLLSGLFLFHYFQRSLVFPFLIRGGKPTPFIPFVLAFLFCACNGYLQVGYIIKYADFGRKWMWNSRLYLGVFLYLMGMFINLQADHILRNLRKPGETGYKIPNGGMFEYVSGANFFGEILEWFGFAVANGTLPAISFFFFTLCNIGPRACHHHKWYKEKFEDYPKQRKALIPFIL